MAFDRTECREILLPKLDISLFSEIADLMNKAKTFQEEEKEFIRKIDKYERNIKVAEELIEKAQSKKEALAERNNFLKNCLEEKEIAETRALKYWTDYGIEINQLSSPEDDFQQYEFIYTKLPNKQSRTNGEIEKGTKTSCVVNLKFHAGRLEIIEQIPEVIRPNELNDLNYRLTANCISPKGKLVDYKLAMIMIRKDLIKSLASLS